MRSRLALLCAVAAAGLAGACGEEEVPPVASSCTGEPDAVVAALGRAPDAVELPDGATISDCLRNARTDAELQNVGVTLANAAEDLEAQAIDGDEDAALRLGYLVGAARTGAATTSGVGAELVRRLERSAGIDGVSTVDDALVQGIAAGEQRG
jgi:hypothetical protein